MKDKKVPIDLDRRRYLLYDLSAVYDIEQIFGSFNKALKSVNIEAFEETAKMLYIGLIHEDDTLTLDYVDRLIDPTNRFEVITKIVQAAGLALPDLDKDQVNKVQTTISDNDNWDWNWLYYIGTVLLLMPEAVFWRSTPKKLFGLWKVHKHFNGLEESESPEQSKAQAWIDQYI